MQNIDILSEEWILKTFGDVTIKESNNVERNNMIKEATIKNNGYCPCMIERTEETKCICKDCRDGFGCMCGLYEYIN